MAAEICLENLSREKIQTIYDTMIIQPKQTYIPGGQCQKVKNSAMMFRKSKDGKSILVPYRFGCILTGKMVNQHIEYRECKSSFGVQLRDYQVDPMEKAMEQFHRYGTTTLSLFPGWGKTIAGSYLAHSTGLSIMVLTHREAISQQWLKTFNLTLPEASVWVVNHKIPDYVPDIMICLGDRYRWIPENFIKGIGVLIIDEAHLFCTAKKVSCLFSVTPKYVIVETATLERDDMMHMMMYSIAGLHSVKKVSTNPYRIYQIYTGVYVEEKYTRRGLDYSHYCKSLAANKDRNNIIVNIVKSNPHRKFMIITKLADHVQLIELLLKQKHINVECDTYYRSKKKYRDSQVLIGTISKMGTGFDEAMLCDEYKGEPSNTIILTHSIKKWQLYEQVRGRIMRSKDPCVIWLYDQNQCGQRHFSGLQKWMSDTNGTVIPLQYLPGKVFIENS